MFFFLTLVSSGKHGSRSKVVGIDLNSELCGSNFIDVIRSLISDS
jgi:hypothetical protein